VVEVCCVVVAGGAGEQFDGSDPPTPGAGGGANGLAEPALLHRPALPVCAEQLAGVASCELQSMQVLSPAVTMRHGSVRRSHGRCTSSSA